MKILLIGANPNNSTDGVIVKGIRNLLKKAYGDYSFDYLFLDDDNVMSADFFFPNNRYDLLVVCGTPWLWDSFQNSVKYLNLTNIFKEHEITKKIFMGIGTCLNLKDIDSYILKRPLEKKGIQDLFDKHLVIARDHITKERLEYSGVDSHLLACPAFFAYDNNEKSTLKDNILIWCDPKKTISCGDWQNSEKLKKYYDICLEFNKQFKPKIFCAQETEKKSALEIDLPEPTVLKGFSNTLEIMKDANHVLSGRVHCAVPAIARGAKVGLLPLDSRFYTVADFNGLTINNTEDFKKMKITEIDLEFYRKEYLKIL